jgi:hypothetical protein
LLNELVVKIGADIREFSDAMSKMSAKLEAARDQFQAIGETLTASVTLPLVAVGAASVKLASDFQESLNKVNVAFGSSASSVVEWSKTSIESMGLASGSALDAAALFGDMATSMGISRDEAAKMAMSLTQLGADLASFKNIPIEQAMYALNGVFTGETESLKMLGVVMTQTQLQAFALTQGITKQVEKMTEAELVALRYAFVMDRTKNAQGDFARTQDGAANQMRMFTENLKELGKQLGEVILPTFTKFIQKVNEILKEFQKLSPEMKQAIVVIGAIVAAVGPLLLILSGLMTTIINVSTALKALSAYMTASAASISAALPVIGLIVAAVVAWGYAIKSFMDNYDKFRIAFIYATESISAKFGIMYSAVKIIIDRLKIAFYDFMIATVGQFGSIGDSFKKLRKEVEDSMMAEKVSLIAKQSALSTAEWRYQTELLNETIKQTVERQNKNAGMTDYMTDRTLIMKGMTQKATEAMEKQRNAANALAISKGDAAKKSKELADAQDKLIKASVKASDELGGNIITALKNRYAQEEQIQRDSLSKQQNWARSNFDTFVSDARKANDLVQQSFRDMADRNIEQIRRTYDEQIMLLDSSTKAQLQDINTQIDAINQQTDSEEKALRDKEFQKAKAEKIRSLSTAKSEEERVKILDELQEMDAKRERELLLEKRRVLIDDLRQRAEWIRLDAERQRKEKEDQMRKDTEAEQTKLNNDLAMLQTNFDNKMKTREQMRLNEEAYFANIEKALLKHYEEINKEDKLQAEARQLFLDSNNKKVIELLNSYNPSWKEAGKSWGQSLLDGIASQSKNIEAAISSIMSKVGKVTSAAANLTSAKPSFAGVGGAIDPFAQTALMNQLQSANFNLYVDGKNMASTIAPHMTDVIKTKTNINR